MNAAETLAAFSEGTLQPAPPAGSWRLCVTGAPVPKARPRAVAFNGRARVYTPGTTARYEDRVRKTALRDWSFAPLRGVELALTVVFYLPVPVSWPRWKRQAALAGGLRPTSKPDIDNLTKSCLDGLCGVLFSDDSLIVEERTAKRYGAEPRVELVLTWRATPTTRAQWETTRS